MRAYFRDRILDLSLRDMKLLAYLLQNAGRPVTRLEIKNAIWGNERNVPLNLVDKGIERLRSRLACHPHTQPIKTVRSIGYLFDADIGGDGEYT